MHVCLPWILLGWEIIWTSVTEWQSKEEDKWENVFCCVKIHDIYWGWGGRGGDLSWTLLCEEMHAVLGMFVMDFTVWRDVLYWKYLCWGFTVWRGMLHWGVLVMDFTMWKNVVVYLLWTNTCLGMFVVQFTTWRERQYMYYLGGRGGVIHTPYRNIL